MTKSNEKTEPRNWGLDYIILHYGGGRYSMTDSLDKARKDKRAATDKLGPGWTIYDRDGNEVT